MEMTQSNKSLGTKMSGDVVSAKDNIITDRSSSNFML